MSGEFEQRMESHWRSLTAEADRSRDPNLATFDFYDWYRSLSAEERQFADTELARWIHSADSRKRFDALAVIGEFRIGSARPAIAQLLRDLPEGPEPETRFLRAKLVRLLETLGP